MLHAHLTHEYRRNNKDKIKKDTDLKYEISKMWKNKVSQFYIVPAVIGNLGMVSQNISRYLEIIGFDGLEKLKFFCWEKLEF